mmetsp:Transcript_33873/g.118497  ORF Transcript_33873/g.118497 Transcript_33873/m.118497 type:complete len:250 (+) Transcript_33873:77-826(+)
MTFQRSKGAQFQAAPLATSPSDAASGARSAEFAPRLVRRIRPKCTRLERPLLGKIRRRSRMDPRFRLGGQRLGMEKRALRDEVAHGFKLSNVPVATRVATSRRRPLGPARQRAAPSARSLRRGPNEEVPFSPPLPGVLGPERRPGRTTVQRLGMARGPRARGPLQFHSATAPAPTAPRATRNVPFGNNLGDCNGASGPSRKFAPRGLGPPWPRAALASGTAFETGLPKRPKRPKSTPKIQNQTWHNRSY